MVREQNSNHIIHIIHSCKEICNYQNSCIELSLPKISIIPLADIPQTVVYAIFTSSRFQG